MLKSVLTFQKRNFNQLKSEIRSLDSRLNEVHTLLVSKRSFSGTVDIMTFKSFENKYKSLITLPVQDLESFDTLNNLISENNDFKDDLVNIQSLVMIQLKNNVFIKQK